MNTLVLGLNDRTELLEVKQGFLVIDDGPLADRFLQKFRRATVFDPREHSFNPLKGVNYRKARALASVFYGSEGKDTLTVRNGKRALTRALMRGERLDELEFGKGDDGKEAQAVIDDILLSPLLKGCLCPENPLAALKGNSIVARIDRAQLGDFDAFVLGSLLTLQFPGQVVISDFGFYARDFHASLIREERLVVGVNCLAELEPTMRQMVLLMETKIGRQCTFDDAQTLANYAGLEPRTNEYRDEVKGLME